jgi:peptidylprolyl isomerase
MRRRTLLLVAVAVLGAAATLVPATSAAAGGSALEPVVVGGTPGQKPTVTFPAPFAVKKSASDVRVRGTGTKAADGSLLLLDYVIVNGRNGEEVETSYGKSPVTLLLDKQATPALVDGLTGASPGSRVVIAVAPKDGLAKNGATAGVKKSDTLLFVVDVKDVTTPLDRATGTAVTPPAGLPTVELAKRGAPTITMPKADAPKSLVVQPLIKGAGPVVQAGQSVNVHYTGALWDGGKVFDSSWKRGQSAQFPIGTRSVIAGWDEGLVGQTVGSQVLLVVPPDKGYGASGQPQAGIKGTDTLVFVVDILGAS